jgi:hypothetical protein
MAGDDRDVELAGERFAQLGEQMSRRLDARPVVLVEHEQAIPFACLVVVRRLTGRVAVAHNDER